MSTIDPSNISSLAAPTVDDLEKLHQMTPGERKALLDAKLGKGAEDIAEGRFVDLNSNKEIHTFFERKRKKYYETAPE